MKQHYLDKQFSIQIKQCLGETNPDVQNATISYKSNLDFTSIFLVQNKGKGPPGRTHRPGEYHSLYLDYSNSSNAGLIGWLGGNKLINELQNINHPKFNLFHTILNLNIMKKQIFILVLFVMAIFANVNKSYGQCVDDALHPMAGKEYDYIVSFAGGGTAKTIKWFVTTEEQIMASGTLASELAAGATTYSITDETTANAKITWAPETIADAMSATGNDYYVVVHYVATNSEGCDVDNIKAYKIEPVNMFQIDLANVDATATILASGNVCTSPVVDATIAAGGGSIVYDYGSSKLYVKVTARNFSGSWDMTVDAGLLTNVNAAETATLTWTDAIGNAGTTVTTGAPITITETTADPEDDEVIYLVFDIDHATFEGLDDRTFAFAVNGVDGAGNPDVDNTNCDPEADSVTQTLLERPEIIDGTDNGPFIMP